jgi:hypothetical protein
LTFAVISVTPAGPDDLEKVTHQSSKLIFHGDDESIVITNSVASLPNEVETMSTDR